MPEDFPVYILIANLRVEPQMLLHRKILGLKIQFIRPAMVRTVIIKLSIDLRDGDGHI